MSSRYQIWDKKTNVITPNGAVFTPEQWVEMHPMGGIDGIKLVIAGGVINGAFCGELTSMVDMYEKQGCDFSKCKSDQDYLDAIEAFEDDQSRPVEVITAEERIAAALEAQVMMALPDEDGR